MRDDIVHPERIPVPLAEKDHMLIDLARHRRRIRANFGLILTPHS